jgi:hypothetical protein
MLPAQILIRMYSRAGKFFATGTYHVVTSYSLILRYSGTVLMFNASAALFRALCAVPAHLTSDHAAASGVSTYPAEHHCSAPCPIQMDHAAAYAARMVDDSYQVRNCPLDPSSRC